MIIRWGTAGTAPLANYPLVGLSPFRGAYGDPATVRGASSINTKVIMYKAGPDMRDKGVGSVRPTQAVRFDCDTGISWNEASAHDAANPSDKWITTTNGTTPLTNAYGQGAQNYCGNIGKVSYQAQWCANVLEQVQAEGWDGIFVDNVAIQQPQGWPFELSTQAAWRAAMLSFAQYVGPYFKSRGYIVCFNANYFISLDSTSDDGTGLQGWWASLGNSATILWNEYSLQTSTTDGYARLTGTNWDQWWQNRYVLISQAQSQGAMGVVASNTTSIDVAVARYHRGSSLLDWNGQGVSSCYDAGYPFSASLWTASQSFALGMPVGTKTTVSGCYLRQFTNGWVAVNPTATSQTVSVGGTNRTIASGDAYIGV
jgi:hypothetical protein